VVAIESEAELGEQVLAQCVEVGGRNFEGGATDIARQVAVHGTGEVVHSGVLAEVGVHDNIEVFELLQDPIHGRRADVGLSSLNREGYLVSGQVSGRRHQHRGNCPLGHGYSLGSASNN
jgi:hypothetical protein